MYKMIPGMINKNSPRRSVDKDLKLSRNRYQGSLLEENENVTGHKRLGLLDF